MKIVRQIFLLILLLCSIQVKGNNLYSRYSDSIEVSLITCYPGPEIYELYGHTAIRVKQGFQDMAFNYGIFSFSEPNFIYRFVKGDAHYILAYYSFADFLSDYEKRGSKVVEQNLNLSQVQSEKLLAMLLENARIENRAYRYDYIYDNCSTRPRDIIERVVGNTLQYTPPKNSKLTFRDIMSEYNKNYSWQTFGIDLALGGGLDHTITEREQMFAPIYLERAIAGSTYIDAQGKRVPLVANTVILNDGKDEGAILTATSWYATPTFLASILLLITVVLSLIDIKKNKISRWYDTIIYILYACGGCFIFFLIFISKHSATSPNFVALWLNPFYFIPAIFIWIKSTWRFLYFYQIVNFAVLLLTALFWWALPQIGNEAFYPLMLAPAVRQINFIILQYKCAKRNK